MNYKKKLGQSHYLMHILKLRRKKMKVYEIIIFIILNFFIFLSTVQSKYIFVSNENSDTITVLNKDKKIIKTIKTGGRPRDMKFSLDKLCYM